MFAQQVAAAQPLLIGLLLLWSSYGKFTGAEQARRTALPRLVGESRAVPAYRLVGVAEAVIGTALLVPPAWTVEAVAAVALAVGFTGYLVYAKTVVPVVADIGPQQPVDRAIRRAEQQPPLRGRQRYAVSRGTGQWMRDPHPQPAQRQ